MMVNHWHNRIFTP